MIRAKHFLWQVEGKVGVITLNRPEKKNPLTFESYAELRDLFTRLKTEENVKTVVVHGAGGNFCAGFDLKELAAGSGNRLSEDGQGPMGPTRMALTKPVIAAIEGYAVAGGLELALWCDLRVAATDATLGVFNRRFGVPLIDLGTIRLPRMIGQGRAMDLILTGRPVAADEALRIGLVERLAEPGLALEEARKLAGQIANFPPGALRADRRSVLGQWALGMDEAMRAEYRGGVELLASGEAQEGARRFAEGAGRHGA